MDDVCFFDDLLISTSKKSPSSFENIESNRDELLISTMNYIIKRYNNCIFNCLSIEDDFKKVSLIAVSKKIKFGSVFSSIGTKLSEGEELCLIDIYNARHYYK